MTGEIADKRVKKAEQTARRIADKTAKMSLWIEYHGNMALVGRLNECQSETAFARRCRVFRPSWIIRRRAYSWTQELGNVETAVCVLIKSNETNLRSIMRPLECYGNASCRIAPLNCQRIVVPAVFAPNVSPVFYWTIDWKYSQQLNQMKHTRLPKYYTM